MNITRKKIENYYQGEWSQIVSAKTINVLVDITCQAYKLNQAHMAAFLNQKESPKLQDLGKI